jgi:hypothetical protein
MHQKARNVRILALKKQDIPTFKAFSNEKDLKRGTLRILGGTFFRKPKLSCS